MHHQRSSAPKDTELTSLLSKAEEGQAGSKSPAPGSASALAQPHMSFFELVRVLSPYFWPDSGSDGAWLNRLRSSSTWLMVILSKACNLVAPFYLSSATNHLIGADYPSAAHSVVVYVSLRLLSSTCKELQGVLYIKVKQQASIQLQETIFTHIHSLSLNWHLSKRTGSVMKSMDRGVEAANQLITYLFLFLLPALAECLAVMLLFFLSYGQYALGLVVLCGVSGYVAVTIFITQYRKRFREETNKHDNAFHDAANDSIVNYETVKYFTNEGYEVSRYKAAVVQYQQANSSTQYSLSALNVSQQALLNATLLVCMLISGRSVAAGRLTIGGWIAIQAWIVTIFAPLNFLGGVYSAVFQALIDIRNLSDLLAQAPDVLDDPQAVALALPKHMGYQQHQQQQHAEGVAVQFDGVSFAYPGQAKGLSDVSFTAAAGSTTAVVGYTGAGKTTLSRLLFRFFDPSLGCIRIHGQDIRRVTQHSLRGAIGIVPQDTVLFNASIYHNISYGRLGASKEEVEAAAEAAQILPFIRALPQGWDTVVGERGMKLSGGEKQRVAIARCLLKNPPIVLLDEVRALISYCCLLC